MNDFIHKYGKPDVHFSMDTISDPAAIIDNMSLTDDQHRQMLDKVVDHIKSGGYVRAKHLSKVFADKRLSKEHFDVLANSELRNSEESPSIDHIVKSKHADSALFDNLLDNHSHHIYTLGSVAHAPGLSPHHIDKIIDHNFSGIDETVAERQDLLPHHMRRLWDTRDQYTRKKLITYQKELPEEIIHDVIDSARMHNPVYSPINPINKILQQKHLNQDHINKLLSHDNHDVREVTKSHFSSP